MTKLLYGCGLRLSECTNIRVNNLNFDAMILTIHDGKDKKDRTLPLPEAILTDLKKPVNTGDHTCMAVMFKKLSNLL